MGINTGQLELLIALAAILALIYAAVQTLLVLRAEEGDERMKEISHAIREGANAFLRREYTVVFIAAILIAIAIAFAFGITGVGPFYAVGFIFGAAGSAAAGAVGMYVSVRANVRTAALARGGDLPKTMQFAFRGGTVTGLSVAGLALLELIVFYWAFGGNVLDMIGLLFGASLMSLFARVGGGIYTKGADVGADIVGKVEAGIPEDDPRNPAVIADNVGDNVGDCAGMAADLFETYIVTAVSAMLLASLMANFTIDSTTFASIFPNGVLFPLVICAWAIVATLIGIAFVRMRPGGSIMGGLYQGLIATTITGIIGIYVLTYYLMNNNWGIFLAAVMGLLVMIFIVLTVDYYTGTYGPVKRVASSSQSGAGPNVITGISIGLEATWITGIVIVVAMLISFLAVGWQGWSAPNLELGLYGIGIAAASMLAVTGMIISIDAFGPITDNAGGIAEMADLPPAARNVTDPLDAVGNTTKAVTKGYAVGSAVLAALALFAAYTFAAASKWQPNAVDPAAAWLNFVSLLSLGNPLVVVGLVIGAILPFFFTSFLMNAVGVAAQAVVFEVRRQFKEIAGILEGKAKPEYGKCVDLVTLTALQQLAVPAVIAVATPLIVGFILGPLALAGLLLGVIVAGFPLAIMMTTGGAAWDNGKKYIELGHYGGKHSDAHKAAVVGDTVGDATKDTAGPAINPLIKVVNTVSILFIGLIISYSLIGIVGFGI
ncbi:MAG: sodium-translocating pyrophosphatase [Thermoplasmata archaeon]